MEFAAGAEPTGDISRFEYKHPLVVLRKVRSADQTVVSRPDNYRVVPRQLPTLFYRSIPSVR